MMIDSAKNPTPNNTGRLVETFKRFVARLLAPAGNRFASFMEGEDALRRGASARVITNPSRFNAALGGARGASTVWFTFRARLEERGYASPPPFPGNA